MEEDRSGLFSEISGFSQRKLKKVQTKVVTGTGEKLVEKRGAKGLQSTSADSASTTSNTSNGQVPARKVDLQVGLVVPGLMIGKCVIRQRIRHAACREKANLPSFVC